MHFKFDDNSDSETEDGPMDLVVCQPATKVTQLEAVMSDLVIEEMPKAAKETSAKILKEIQPDVPLDQKLEVHYVYSRDPLEFYVCLDYDASVYLQNMTSVTAFKMQPLSPEEIFYNTVCLAQYSDMNYYRAEITHVLKDYVEVYFIDWGNRYTVGKDGLKHVDEMLMRQKVVAIKCSLNGWNESYTTKYPQEEFGDLKKKFNTLISSGQQLEAIFYPPKPDDEVFGPEVVKTYEVDLFARTAYGTKLVNEDLLFNWYKFWTFAGPIIKILTLHYGPTDENRLNQSIDQLCPQHSLSFHNSTFIIRLLTQTKMAAVKSSDWYRQPQLPFCKGQI